MYDYLIVGAGLFGSVFAHEMTRRGKRCLIIDRRGHIGGNVRCEEIEGITVHKYGAHIFHTNDEYVWNYINRFAEFNRFTNTPIANYKGELYNLPFNMNTFYKLWGVTTPEDAQKAIESRRVDIGNPQNLEEQALSLVGTEIYEKLIRGYTEKQWGRKCTDLPAFIIKRIPLRFTFDNNYFGDKYQGIPVAGYNGIVSKLLDGCDILLNTDYISGRMRLDAMAEKIVFTGMIDEFFEYRFGSLEYRSLTFETEILDTPNYQGNAVVNYTDGDVPYTRIIEHKHFEFGAQPKTVITREYPAEWTRGAEPYYPVNDDMNTARYEQYRNLAVSTRPDVLFGGRLGEYRYYDMWQVIRRALDAAASEDSI